jgi:hypothetical protein
MNGGKKISFCIAIWSRKCEHAELAQDHRPVAVIKTPQGPGRKISECIALPKAREEQFGVAPVPDPDFGKDVQAAIDAHREPLNPPSWD